MLVLTLMQYTDYQHTPISTQDMWNWASATGKQTLWILSELLVYIIKCTENILTDHGRDSRVLYLIFLCVYYISDDNKITFFTFSISGVIDRETTGRSMNSLGPFISFQKLKHLYTTGLYESSSVTYTKSHSLEWPTSATVYQQIST